MARFISSRYLNPPLLMSILDAHHLTPINLARLLGWSQPSVSTIINHTRRVSPSRQRQLLTLLNTGLGYNLTTAELFPTQQL